MCKLEWPSGSAPALIVQTTAAGWNYAFKPSDIINTFGAVARTRAEKEMAIHELRARVQVQGFSGTSNPARTRVDRELANHDLRAHVHRGARLQWHTER